VILVAAGAAGFAASWTGLDVSLARVTTAALSTDRSHSWAPVPEEVAMPAAAPDDPMAYRGSRFRMVNGVSGQSVEPGGKAVPWLRSNPSGYSSANVVYDGRRWMVWFFRLAEPKPLPPGPLMAVLDVLVLPEGWRSAEGRWGERGCGPDGDVVIIEGDVGWRLNRSAGRVETIDPDDARCYD
jgi:hypothetical protein